MDFPKRLIKWYLQNKRDLPWRDISDPYRIWLSEIMLQQTRVAQGLPYYLAFVEAFPTVFGLAAADEEKVLKLWQGLGYYSRARNLHATAKKVANDGGIFPSSYQELLKLKGIGEYTAAAIASFSYNEAVPVVDGNVFRVLSRVFDIETDIASSRAKKEFTALANELIPKNEPALFNQAIMEFGALQCVPRNPDCAICPVNDACLALKLGKVDQLPVKLKKQKVTDRYFNYLVFSDEHENLLLNKRTQKGIWHNLYEFPLVETQTVADHESIYGLIHSENRIVSVSEATGVIHKLSHQHLHIKFWEVEVEGVLPDPVSSAQIRSFPVPIVLHNFIEKRWR
jgi:A/G-specific adenine glycosylase